MLLKRQVLILQMIVENFINTNQPVGSKEIAKTLDYSSATIRNDMAKLEKEGFITKTHTSSGRIPSECGYRYYVDYINTSYDISAEDEKVLKSILKEKVYSEKKFLEKNAIILSNLTDCTAVILAPTKTDKRINKIEVILLSSRSILVILITNTGEVHQQNYKMQADFTQEEIEEVNKLLKTYFYDVDMATAHILLHKEIEKYLKERIDNYDMILIALTRLLNNKIKKTIALGGKYNLLKKPDINNLDKLKEVMTLFEEDNIIDLIDDNSKLSGTKVKIGKELDNKKMNDLSLVTSKFFSDKGEGVIAVFGPKRMNYKKVMTLINCVKDNLNNNLKE